MLLKSCTEHLLHTLMYTGNRDKGQAPALGGSRSNEEERQINGLWQDTFMWAVITGICREGAQPMLRELGALWRN